MIANRGSLTARDGTCNLKVSALAEQQNTCRLCVDIGAQKRGWIRCFQGDMPVHSELCSAPSAIGICSTYHLDGHGKGVMRAQREGLHSPAHAES